MSTQPPLHRYKHTFSATLENVSQTQQVLEAFFKSSTVGLGICDKELRCCAMNETLSAINGLPAQAPLGKTIREIMGDAAQTVEPIVKQVFATGRPVCDVKISAKLPRRNEVGHWVETHFPIRDREGNVSHVGSIVVEITDQKRLEESLHSLTRKLLRAQDEEQRRIARDLHDSISQYHAALKMNLLRLRRKRLDPGQRGELLAQSMELLERCMSETRTISYLLHPPLLEEMGFASATRWYIQGFAQRSGIKVNLKLLPDLDRLPAAVEIALFRVLQEALTNVHRYAHSSTVDVEIERTDLEITLQVRDYGRGIAREKLRRLRQRDDASGLGIPSMRERIQELGGNLDIESSQQGTIVRAEIPLTSSLQPAQPAQQQAASA